jgi:hypothetical protein
MDPATPQAQAAIARLIERDVRPRRDDRQLIGYFVDNELGWYDASLFRYWAAEPATARLKQRHYALLLQHYRGKLAQFLKDFDVLPRPHHFTDLAQPLQQISVRPGRRPPVIDQFVAALADDYYATVAAAVRAADPNHLLLGDRYASGYSQAVARASARHTDVVSVNYAGTEPGGWVSPAFFESLHRVTGKPLLVSEIYTTAHENRSGNRNRHGHYLVVGTQRERAATAAGMAAQLARMPYVVGYHWFQWSDQPTSGREDGEDFNMGLVDLEDRPYEELTAAFSRVHAQVAALHQQGPLLQGLQVRDGAWSVPALSPTLDGRLEDWPLAQHWASDTAASATHLPFGDFYLGWQPEGVVLGLAYNDYSLGAPATDDVRTRRRLLLTLGAAGGAARSHTVLGFDERAQGRPLALEARGAPGLRGEQRIRNLLTTAELLIPAALFGYPRLQAGQVLRLDSRFLLEGETRELRWPARGAARLRLAPAATPAAAE